MLLVMRRLWLALSLAAACTPVGPAEAPVQKDRPAVEPGEHYEPSEPIPGDEPRCARGAPGRQSEAIDPRAEIEQGRLVVRQGEQWRTMPLQRIAIDTEVVGTVAETRVTQVFHNPFSEPVEAVYVFPLPADGAIDDFALRAGDLRVRGEIHERKQAQTIYAAAKAEGKTAALLEQERPNIFTQSVANIPPGTAVEVELHVVHEVRQVDGVYELALPTTVGKRFIPGAPLPRPATGTGAAPDTTAVPDASRITPPTQVCADLDLQVAIRGGHPIELVRAKHHRIGVERRDNRVEVGLADGPTLPNRDFVLSWRNAGAEPRAALLAQRDAGGEGYFTLVVQPPSAARDDQVRPRELIFILDTSGSMGGWPLDTAKRVMHAALDEMRPDDAFQLVDFNQQASALGPAPIVATEAGKRQGHDYVTALQPGGGTLMNAGIDLALGMPRDPERVRFLLLLTDGFIGNERDIFRGIEARLGDARLFGLGIGTSVNRYLLDGVARIGRGAVGYVVVADDAVPEAERFYARIARPVLTDIEIDWGGLAVREVVPAAIPDVFAGQPVVVFGRFTGTPKGTAKLRGRLGRAPVEVALKLDFADGDQHGGLSSMWARRMIDEIEDYPAETRLFGGDADAVRAKVIELSLRYRVLTRHTAFVAVAEQTGQVGETSPMRLSADEDGDGFANTQDTCPDQPETFNGYMDGDGCPDEIPTALARYTGTIRGVSFDRGSAKITPKRVPILDRAVAAMKEFPTVRVEISGHTSPDEPRELGHKRALAVRDFMVKAGIEAGRFELRNAGPDEPIDTNKTADGRAHNRRIEFVILVQ